jgi:nucleotide-binding universal stress UspA family protein
MTTIKTIVVPTDFSETSTAALEYGWDLAEALGASLHVLHVILDPYGQPWAPEAFAVSLPGLIEQWEREAMERMQGMVPPAIQAKVRVTFATRVGHPFVEILRYAKEQPVDLIVMGTHGRGPVAHMLMGSVAEKVVRKAACPVLTVRPQAEA